MMDLDGKKLCVDGYPTTIHLDKYSEGGRLAIILICDDDGEEYGTLTVNMPEVPLDPGEIIIKTWSENEQMAKAALMSGLFRDTGKRVPTGFVQAHIWRIEKLPNVRFWEYINGSPVKLSLSAEQIINWSRLSPTDEGWAKEARTYEYAEDGMVTLLIVTEEKDCDGRIKTVWEGYFDPREERELLPAEKAADYPGLPIPVWHEKKRRQRDYTAEAMGY